MLFWLFMVLIVFCGAFICVNFNLIGCVSTLTMLGSLWEMFGVVDNITISILLMLVICFGYAYLYTGHYFCGDVMGVKLNQLICLFVSVMFSLVLTGDFLTTLVFWEYLGVVSFFLILFYSNYLSLRSSVVTLVASRFGDVSMFLLIALSCYVNYLCIVPAVIIYFIVFTKSAGFPFISWLLEAMRAPTPVSSLVHSSTLVAAGVWFSMRYNVFSYLSDSMLYLITLLLTIFITGLCCFFFLDLKKIVALSTCNNISWCLVYLICGDVVLSLFQLVSHGVSKCLLFMLVGDVMSGTGGSQASNCVYTPRLYGNWGLFGLFSIVLGLSGAPFIGVFFTKHLFLTYFFSGVNLSVVCFIYLCVFLSYFYSFRLCSILNNLNNSCSSGVLFSFGSGIMVYFWLIINCYLSNILDEVNLVGYLPSTILLIFQLVSCLTAYYLYNSNLISNWSSSLFGCDSIVEMFYNWYCSASNMVSLFFFRWDNNLMTLFRGYGSSIMYLFNFNILNIIMLFFIFLMCFNIVY
uniref:NADH:ubiquinone reductase (H(+)-translocating) n=1 Tax=Rhinebothrium sp. MZUSP 8023 TaxID=2899485 RepID=A0A8K1SXC0_9CEST|nr:NADH dehydrogenase subunit 5 [Rhinebothrium sp. MZUSP 8023]